MQENKPKRRAKFPALHSTRWFSFVEKKPEQMEGETDEAFARRVEMFELLEGAEIEVRMMDRETVLNFESRLYKIFAEEQARSAANPNGPPVSVEFYRDMRDLHVEIVKAYVCGVRGFDVGEVDMDSVRDPKLIATLLETAGLLADASRIARTAQNPTPVQSEPPGSS